MAASKRHVPAGFALVELVTVLSLILLAAGVAVPIVHDRINVAARAQAIGNLRRISADLLNYRRDTGVWPAGARFAYTDGTPAVGDEASFAADLAGMHVSRFLGTNERNVAKWQGPYMSVSRPDPWGHRYVVVLEGLREPLSPYGWVLSAGQDGIFQTDKMDRTLRGDDLGLLLR